MISLDRSNVLCSLYGYIGYDYEGTHGLTLEVLRSRRVVYFFLSKKPYLFLNFINGLLRFKLGRVARHNM